jgi:hypothetical protein
MMPRAMHDRPYTKGCEAGSGACTEKAGAGEPCEFSTDCYGGSYSTSGAGLHSSTSELNLSNLRTRLWAKSGYTVDRRARVELNWERM